MLLARHARLIALRKTVVFHCELSVHVIHLALEDVLVEQTAAMKAGSSLLREHNVLGQL
jgi:hypothetical protein